MSIETEINRISTNVSDTLSAISEMGGEVPDGATSDDMASGVRSIPVGAKIDDTTPNSTTTYSSSKIESEISKLNEANATQDTEIAKKANDADLAKVAKSGSYDDLTGKPTIPTVPESLKNPNKLKLTGAVNAEYDGSSEVSVEIPAGGGGEYNLPVASATQLGGVMPAAKTNEMTQAVGVDEAGGLWAVAGIYPVVSMTDATAELLSNTFYRWGEIAALSITLATPTNEAITNEYCFEFVSGSTATTLTVPDTIRWAQEPSIEVGKTYQVSILNGIGVIVGA